MSERVAVLSALLLTSVMLSGTLMVAWHALGRARHALIWSVSFAVGALQWLLNIGFVAWWPESELVFGLVNICGTGMVVLLLSGFRARAGRTAPGPAGTLLLAAAALVIIIGVARHQMGWAMATPLIARAALLPLAAAVVPPQGRRCNASEWWMIVLLLGFAAFSAVVAVLTILRLELGWLSGDLDRQLMLLGMPAAFTGVGLAAVLLLTSDLAERLRLLATQDSLTGVLNRRGFHDAAARALANAVRQGRPVSVALADVDRFKSINDEHGHAMGDAALVRVAGYLAGAVRTGDLVGRVGGEEFAILLDGASDGAAYDVIERIRSGLEQLELGLPQPIRLTASFGLVCPDLNTTSLEGALNQADAALYAAKLAGRNRVICAQPGARSPADTFEGRPTS